MKKLFALLSVAVLTFSLAACGGNELDDSITDDPDIDYSEETLTIWSFTDELKAQGDVQYFKDNFTAEGKEYEGMEVEYVEIPTADYLTSILPTLRSGAGAPDVFTGELDMLLKYMEGGYLANLEAMMKADEDLDFDDTKADFVDYIWEAGQNPDGVLKSLSWQVTPGGIFFKTDMAKAVWGDEAGFPADGTDGYNQAVSDWVSENKFASLQGLIDASQEVKNHDANWRLFPNDDAVRWFSQQSDNPESWLAEDGLLNADRLETEENYMEAVADLYGENIDNSLTANIGEWSGPWFQGMGKSFEAADETVYQTMAYSMPTWGLFYVIEPSVEQVDSAGNTCGEAELEDDSITCAPKGNWGVASGPNSYFWGGTYLNIYQGSPVKEPAYDFVSSMLFDKERMTARAENGDVYARKSIMEDVTADFEGNPVLGGMNHYEFFLSEANKISLDYITKYDRTLNEIMGDVVNDYKKGNYDSKSAAFSDFYSDLQTAHPELYRSSELPYQD